MKIPRFIWMVATLSLILALLILIDAMPLLRGGYGWQWQYVPVSLLRAVPLIIATIVYVGGGYFLLRRTQRALPTLLWSMVGAAIIPLFVIALRSDDVGYELFARTASGLTTGPHWAAAQID